jgi:hypothetical protein
MQRAGGRLYETTKTSQHEYDSAIRLKGKKPFVTKLMQTFLASLAKLESKAYDAFHALSGTHSLCHLMCLAVFFEINKCFNRCIRGM